MVAENATSKFYKYDGNKSTYLKFLDEARTALSKKVNTQAAPELIKHWDGGHSYETIRTIAEGDPTVVGDLGLLGGGPTEFTRLADIPQAWKEFCEKYVLGDVNLDNPTQDRNMDKVHYGTPFIYLLSNTRDRVVHKAIKDILTGNAALTARQVPDGKGHQLFLKSTAKSSRVGISEVVALQ